MTFDASGRYNLAFLRSASRPSVRLHCGSGAPLARRISPLQRRRLSCGGARLWPAGTLAFRGHGRASTRRCRGSAQLRAAPRITVPGRAVLRRAALGRSRRWVVRGAQKSPPLRRCRDWLLRRRWLGQSGRESARNWVNWATEDRSSMWSYAGRVLRVRVRRGERPCCWSLRTGLCGAVDCGAKKAERFEVGSDGVPSDPT